jgi:hypothetical protein
MKIAPVLFLYIIVCFFFTMLVSVMHLATLGHGSKRRKKALLAFFMLSAAARMQIQFLAFFICSVGTRRARCAAKKKCISMCSCIYFIYIISLCVVARRKNALALSCCAPREPASDKNPFTGAHFPFHRMLRDQSASIANDENRTLQKPSCANGNGNPPLLLHVHPHQFQWENALKNRQNAPGHTSRDQKLLIIKYH